MKDRRQGVELKIEILGKETLCRLMEPKTQNLGEQILCRLILEENLCVDI
jgi:hypothetical protein